MIKITERWKKLKTWQKAIYILFSLWLIDLFLWLWKKWKVIFLITILSVWLLWSLQEKNSISNNASKVYSYTFVKEDKQLTWNCSRSEWVYSVPNNVEKSNLEPILREIYRDKKRVTDRTNISLYTELSLKQINVWKSSISIAFLNDWFNCDWPRKVEIKENYDIYHSTKDL